MSTDLPDELKPNCSMTQSGILFTCINIVSYSGHGRDKKKYNNDSTVRNEIRKVL